MAEDNLLYETMVNNSIIFKVCGKRPASLLGWVVWAVHKEQSWELELLNGSAAGWPDGGVV